MIDEGYIIDPNRGTGPWWSGYIELHDKSRGFVDWHTSLGELVYLHNRKSKSKIRLKIAIGPFEDQKVTEKFTKEWQALINPHSPAEIALRKLLTRVISRLDNKSLLEDTTIMLYDDEENFVDSKRVTDVEWSTEVRYCEMRYPDEKRKKKKKDKRKR